MCSHERNMCVKSNLFSEWCSKIATNNVFNIPKHNITIEPTTRQPTTNNNNRPTSLQLLKAARQIREYCLKVLVHLQMTHRNSDQYYIYIYIEYVHYVKFK